MNIERRLDHPLAPALLGLVWAVVVVGFLVGGAGDVSRLVRAAPPWSDPAATPPDLTIAEKGYDGQFYYRLALDPFTDQLTDRGITFDRAAYRQQRIVYPVLVWAASGGDERRVPLSLVLVNVAAMFAIGWIGGVVARGAGRHALWGALFVSYPGFVTSLARDLTEIVAAAFALGALALVRAERPLSAALAFVGAGLARETTALLAVVTAFSRGVASPRTPGRWAPFALPLLVLVGWQGVLAARWGGTPVGQGGEAFDPPLLGILAAAWLNGERFQGQAAIVWALIIVVVLTTVVIGLRAMPATRFTHERVAWYAYLALAAVLEANIWANSAPLRTLTELGLLTGLMVLAAPRRLSWVLLGAQTALCVVLVATGVPI